jgi:CBS domain containing-hemolysin-like protein
MAIGIILIIVGLLIAGLGRLTARTYAKSGPTQLALWVVCLLVGLAICVTGFLQL